MQIETGNYIELVLIFNIPNTQYNRIDTTYSMVYTYMYQYSLKCGKAVKDKYGSYVIKAGNSRYGRHLTLLHCDAYPVACHLLCLRRLPSLHLERISEFENGRLCHRQQHMNLLFISSLIPCQSKAPEAS